MKKLFTIMIETEATVVAENEADAVAQVKKSWFEVVDVWNCNVRASEATYHTGDLDEIPFGYRDPADPDRTVQGWIDAGAAPKLKVRK